MWLSLGLSILIHIGLFVALQDAFPIPWVSEKLRTYQVELLRPPVEGLEKEPGASAEIEQEGGASAEDQETISLDTEDTRYVSYARAVKESIAKKWKYPPDAKANLIEGRLQILFSLNRTGELVRIQVLTPSGASTLDQEAVRAVRAAAPFPPVPQQVKAARLNIEANFEYRLTAKK